MAEYEMEALVADLGLPREVIQEDVAKGRLVLDQHRGDPRYYVDHDILLDYLTERVTELRSDQKRAFWQAVRKILADPTSESRMDPEEFKAVLRAIDRQIDNC